MNSSEASRLFEELASTGRHCKLVDRQHFVGQFL